jgi:hypothetical protein
MSAPHGYAAALALTLAVEVPLYWAGLGRTRRAAAAGVVANLVSHPLIFIVLPVSAAVGEPIAWAVEALIALALVRGDPLRVAAVVLAANAASLVLGAVVLR